MFLQNSDYITQRIREIWESVTMSFCFRLHSFTMSSKQSNFGSKSTFEGVAVAGGLRDDGGDGILIEVKNFLDSILGGSHFLKNVCVSFHEIIYQALLYINQSGHLKERILDQPHIDLFR